MPPVCFGDLHLGQLAFIPAEFHCITHMIFLQLREAACTDAQRTYGRAVQAAQGGWGPVCASVTVRRVGVW